MSITRKAHWERVYATTAPTDVGWYQANPTLSLELIAATGISHSQKIIEVGGGASVLVDRLLDKGFEAVTLLDISAGVIAQARERLGRRAEQVTWIEGDVTEVEISDQYDLWHDRAVFHFLTDPDDRVSMVPRDMPREMRSISGPVRFEKSPGSSPWPSGTRSVPGTESWGNRSAISPGNLSDS